MRLGTILELPPGITTPLEEHGIKTDNDLISMTPMDILRILPPGTITLGEISRCKDIVARASAASGYSANSLMRLSPSVLSSTLSTALPLSLDPIKHYLVAHSGRVVELSGHRDSKKSVCRTDSSHMSHILT